MPGIEIKGRSKIANYRHGGRTGKFGGGRTNLLEELGRVEAEPSNRNRRADRSRVHGELNRGYAKGGRAGHAHGMSAVKKAIKKVTEPQGVFKPKDFKGKGSDKIKKKKRHENLDIPGSPGPEKGKYPGIDKAMSNIKKSGDIWGPGKAKGGRIGLKKVLTKNGFKKP